MSDTTKILLPVLITVTITAVVGYMLYQKYKPTVDALNTSNKLLGEIEAPIIGIENWLGSVFGSAHTNGNNPDQAGTTAMLP